MTTDDRSGPNQSDHGETSSGPRRPPRSGQSAPVPEPTSQFHADDADYFDLPQESRVPRWLVTLIVLVVVVVGIVGGAMWWYHVQVDPRGGPGEKVEVQVPLGASTSKVSSLLDDNGVISSATIFNFYVGGKDLSSVQAGTYTFRTNSSFDDAIAVLNAGPTTPLSSATTKLSIPEGYTVSQIVESIHKQVPRLTVSDLKAALDGGQVPTALKPDGTSSYEGLLFPATYEVGDDDTALDVLTTMAQEMETRVSALGIDQAAADVSQQWGIDVDAYDLITTASLVQEEAGSPEEAPKVATVIYNRLRDGVPLGIDATSRYLANIEGGEPDYDSPSPFNTRSQTGLPPTPIAAPGEYALDAAFNPADGPWLYYVLTDPGVHTFVVSYDDFLAAKQTCIAKDLGCG